MCVKYKTAELRLLSLSLLKCIVQILLARMKPLYNGFKSVSISSILMPVQHLKQRMQRRRLKQKVIKKDVEPSLHIHSNYAKKLHRTTLKGSATCDFARGHLSKNFVVWVANSPWLQIARKCLISSRHARNNQITKAFQPALCAGVVKPCTYRLLSPQDIIGWILMTYHGLN